jgi:hypothetical protein
MPPSRRALLSAATAAATALAGCSATGTTERDSANERPSPDGGGGRDPPPYAYLRRDEPDPVAWFEDEDGGDRSVHPDRLVLDAADRAESVTYADVDGARAVREFVAGTDFETATVVVDQRAVEACYRLELCSARWSATEVDFDYSRVALAYDVSCEADAKATEARFLRIPDALDRDSLRSFSSRIGRGGCAERHDPVAGSDIPGHAGTDGTTTDGRVRSAGFRGDGRVRSAGFRGDGRVQSVAPTEVWSL